MTTSTNILQHRIATEPATKAELHEGTFVNGESGFHLIFRYDHLNGYRSISISDMDVLLDLANQIQKLAEINESSEATRIS